MERLKERFYILSSVGVGQQQDTNIQEQLPPAQTSDSGQ